MIRAREDRWFDRFRRNGDPRLLAKVFDRTAAELWKVASHLCRDRHTAEDAVQGTFLVAIEAQRDWDAARPLLPWLLGLLVNRVRDLRRRQRAPDPARVALPAGERDPADLAAGGELGSAVRDALQRVPEPYRDTLERHLVHGQQAPEIAAAIGVPAGTVRMRLHRGLDQLRQRLPAGLAGGGIALALTRESFAAMRRAVLTSVPGGAEVAAVAATSAGHFVAGWLGVIAMKKTMMAVVVAGLVLAGSWWLWQPFADAAPSLSAHVTANVRPLARADGVANPGPSAPGGREAAAPAAAPQPGKGRLRVVLRAGDDGRALPAMSLDVLAGMRSTPPDASAQPDDPRGPFLAHGNTDADGVATFAVPPGRATVRSLLHMPDEAPWQADVQADAETELAITLPVRLRTDVEVVDAAGTPVVGARILGRTSTDVGVVVDRELGRTDATGHWRAAFVERSVPVRAVHEGRVGSRAVELDARTPTARLVLADGPATVTGTVFDRGGRPLPRAQVTIQSRVADFAGERPFAVVADDSGRYAAEHVPPGPITVLALGPIGVAEQRCGRADATVVAGKANTVDVAFAVGASIVVSMTGADGKPVADQHVAAVPQPDAQMWVYLASSGAVTTTTDANGIATLADVMPGDYEVQAFLRSGEKRTKVAVAPGQQVRVDWSLGGATFVDVRLVDDKERALADWVVVLQPMSGPQREARTDADGVVRFADVAAAAGKLVVRSAASSIPSLRVDAPTGRRTTLQVPATALPTAELHGRVQVAAELDPSTLTAELLRYEDGRGQDSATQALTATATFRFAALPAGTYLLGFRRGPREYLGAPQQFVVAPAATLDVGAIALQLPGDLAVVVRAADGGRVAGLRLALALATAPRDFGVAPIDITDTTCTLKAMPSGRYELLVWGDDIAPTFVPLVVAAGHNEVPVTVERGTATRLQLTGDVTGRGAPMLTLHRDGQQLLRLRCNRADLTLGLRPGAYRIEVESEGAKGSAEFRVLDQPGDVQVAMRR